MKENPKTECRNPKEARNPKSEKGAASCSASDFAVRLSFGFRHSVFGFDSTFGLFHQ